MNILIMADYRTPASGNFVASLLELAERLRERGSTVLFLFPDNRKGGYSWSKWLEANGFRVILCDTGMPRAELAAELSEIVKKYQIELIHSHFGCCHRILTLERHKLGNVQVLIHDHMDFSPEGNQLAQRIRTTAWAAIYRLMGIGVVSVMNRKKKTYWLVGRKNWYVPNGLSLRRNIACSMDREERRQRLGIEKDEKLCLFLGWDMYRKGLDIAIRAVAQLRQRGIPVCLGLVGFGDKPSEQAEQWIRERTGIDPKCTWLRFFPSTEDMFSYHRAADVYLSASRKEAFSYGILEAISQNVPVVMSDIEGTQWAAQYDKCIQYPVENVTMCADALEKAWEKRMDLSNQAIILKEYGIDVWCERMTEIYQKMVK